MLMKQNKYRIEARGNWWCYSVGVAFMVKSPSSKRGKTRRLHSSERETDAALPCRIDHHWLPPGRRPVRKEEGNVDEDGDLSGEGKRGRL